MQEWRRWAVGLLVRDPPKALDRPEGNALRLLVCLLLGNLPLTRVQPNPASGRATSTAEPD
eukprot:5406530-Lingulodinium_polyedra.AAC.1